MEPYLKLSFDNNIRYFVNEKKRTVTCVLNAKFTEAPRYTFPYGIPEYTLCDKIKGVGVAKCAEGDTFNADFGKSIARARAEIDAYMNANRYIEKYKEALEKSIHSLDNFISKSYNYAVHNLSYIDKKVSCLYDKHDYEMNPSKGTNNEGANDFFLNANACPGNDVGCNNNDFVIPISVKRKKSL